MGDVPSWISAVVAVACMVGSFVGWMGSRKSEAEARQVADRHREAAERSADALEEQVSQGRASAEQAERAVEVASGHADAASRSAAAAEKIASALTLPRLVVEWKSYGQFCLRNTSDSPVEVEALVEPDPESSKCPVIGLDLPVTLGPQKSVSGKLLPVGGAPRELSLRVTGEKEPVVVPLSGRPPKS